MGIVQTSYALKIGTALHSLLSGKTTVFKTTMCRDYTVCILLCHTEQEVKNIISLQKLEF